MSLFLWEIGCEDIPARMQPGAVAEYQQRLVQAAKDHGLVFDHQEVWVSPRRLATRLSGVDKVTRVVETKTGPLVAQGDEALRRFCAKWRVQPHHCVSVSTPRGLAWSATVTPPDIDLPQRLCAMAEQVLHAMVWPKRMIWNQAHISWIRPIRWMVCLLDDQVISWNWSQPLAKQPAHNSTQPTNHQSAHHYAAHRWTEAHRLRLPPCAAFSKSPVSAQTHHSTHEEGPSSSAHCAASPGELWAWSGALTQPESSPNSVSCTNACQTSPQLQGDSGDRHNKALVWHMNPSHRRWGVMLEHAKDYDTVLGQAGVVVCSHHRTKLIARDIDKAAHDIGGRIYQPTAHDLLMENAGLVQWPQAVVCSFDPAFLTLPMEVIVTALHVHQRCFCVVDKNNDQQLLPYFIMIADGALPTEPIRIGYERVVAARLQDAMFFWAQDRATPLLDHGPALVARVFFAGLGSFQDKTHRLVALMTWIAQQRGCDSDIHDIQAMTRLSKMDLFTAMVNEFPTLQGIMGSHYATHEGYGVQQAQALSQPYRLARWSLHEVQEKSTPWGAWLTIADSMDTLVGFFALGKKSTGSKDPLALRRTCHGLIKALMVHGQHLSVPALLEQSLNAYHEQGLLKDQEFMVEEWWGFVIERLEFIFKETGITLPKKIYAHLLSKWRTVWDTPTVWTQCQHYQRVHHDYPAAIKAYDRLGSLACSFGHSLPSPNREGLTTPWEQEAMRVLSPLSVTTIDRWSEAVNALLDHVSIQDPVWGTQRLGLIHDLIQVWHAWMPLDAPHA